MKITLIVLTDGRLDCLQVTLASCDRMIGLDQFSQRVIINDSADTDYQRTLIGLYGDQFDIKPPATSKRGFGGAIRAAWSAIDADADYVFHLEDDFQILRRPPLGAMALALDHYPHIQQFALRRQPWNDHEKAAGGIVEQWPDKYTDITWNGHQWLEHNLFFTTNPSLYRRSLIDFGWPNGKGSEGEFTRRIQAADPHYRFAFWGPRTDDPWVTHIGDHRIGTGY